MNIHERDVTFVRVLEYAVESGDVILMEWLENNFPAIREQSPPLMDKAAAAGRLDIMKWLLRRRYVNLTNMAAFKAVEKGHLDMVKWMIENKLVKPGHAVDFAISCGQLELSKELYRLYRSRFHPQFPRYGFSRNDHRLVSGCAIATAASKGHLSVVQWLAETVSNDFQGNMFEERLVSTAIEAAKNGHLEMVKYLHELDASFTVGKNAGVAE